MRVLISSPVHPPELGGPAVYAPSLARHLNDKGHAVRVVSFSDRPERAREFARGYEFTAVPRTLGRLRRHRAYARILTEFAAEADVLVGLDHLAGPAVRAARSARIPLVLRVMVDPAWELASRFGWSAASPDELRGGRRGLRVRLVQGMQRRWWRSAALVVCPSHYLRSVVRSYGIEEGRTTVLHNPYHETMPEELPERLDRGGRLIAIARLVAWKRIDHLLEELERLPASFTLDVLGDGPEEPDLAHRVRERGLAERVRFHGNVSHAEALARLRDADALVSVSRYEGMSHTLVEAMAVGTPVVATAVGGNVELLEEGRGLLLPEEGPWMLDRLLPSWLGGPAEHARRRAFDWVAQFFDRSRVFDRFESRLREIVHG